MRQAIESNSNVNLDSHTEETLTTDSQILEIAQWLSSNFGLLKTILFFPKKLVPILGKEKTDYVLAVKLLEHFFDNSKPWEIQGFSICSKLEKKIYFHNVVHQQPIEVVGLLLTHLPALALILRQVMQKVEKMQNFAAVFEKAIIIPVMDWIFKNKNILVASFDYRLDNWFKNTSHTSAQTCKVALETFAIKLQAELLTKFAIDNRTHINKNCYSALECFQERICRLSKDDPKSQEWLGNFLSLNPNVALFLDAKTKKLNRVLNYVAIYYEKEISKESKKTPAYLITKLVSKERSFETTEPISKSIAQSMSSFLQDNSKSEQPNQIVINNETPQF